MTTSTLHPRAEEYLRRLERAARTLPGDRRRELVSEIESHLAEAIGPDATDVQALDVIERLGPPGEIVEAELPVRSRPDDRRTWREWTAVFLLPLGGFLFGVGWIVGLIFLWSSRAWTTRQKWIGTLVIPGGIATGVVAFLVLGTTAGSKCITKAYSRSAGATVHSNVTTHCSGGAGTGVVVLLILMLAVLVIAPIVSAVYLARRAT
jgi:hypothetical protein